ncbi:MAG: ComEA family DNA-binding protein, partial [Flavobacteriales bacterium]
MRLDPNSSRYIRGKQAFERSKLISLLVAVLLITSNVLSQQDEIRNNIIEQRIEEIAGNLDEGSELDYTTLFEDLAYYYEHPLNLNNAKPEELKELYLISDPQIAALLRHIDTYGPLRNIFELQAVPGFTPEVIRTLTDFITAEPVFSFKNISFKDIAKETRHDLFIRHKRVIEKQAGFENDTETGVPDFLG